MTITEKGQVTIPQPIREALGLRPASEVEFILEGDHAILRKKEQVDMVAERMARYRGAATNGMSTDDILALTRA
jgi:antitoxin PrlF